MAAKKTSFFICDLLRRSRDILEINFVNYELSDREEEKNLIKNKESNVKKDTESSVQTSKILNKIN